MTPTGQGGFGASPLAIPERKDRCSACWTMRPSARRSASSWAGAEQSGEVIGFCSRRGPQTHPWSAGQLLLGERSFHRDRRFGTCGARRFGEDRLCRDRLLDHHRIGQSRLLEIVGKSAEQPAEQEEGHQDGRRHADPHAGVAAAFSLGDFGITVICHVVSFRVEGRLVTRQTTLVSGKG